MIKLHIGCMSAFSAQAETVLISSVFKNSLASVERRVHKLPWVVGFITSCESVVDDEMFLRRITAANFFASTYTSAIIERVLLIT